MTTKANRNFLAESAALLEKGFATKTEQKRAADLLNRAWSQATYAAADPYSLPHYAHQIREKHYPLLPAAKQIAELCASIKAAPIAPKAKEADDTKMRDAAASDPLTYTDMNGDERGVCWCCGRSGFKLNAQGRMSNHGYQRPGWGYQTSGCIGSKRTPQQALDMAIEHMESQVSQLEELLGSPSNLQSTQLRDLRRLTRTEFSNKRGSRYQRGNHADKIRSVRRDGATASFVFVAEGRLDGTRKALSMAREAVAHQQG